MPTMPILLKTYEIPIVPHFLREGFLCADYARVLRRAKVIVKNSARYSAMAAPAELPM